MVTTRLAAVGAFVIAGLVLFAVGLFFIGERRMLFGNTFIIFAEFQEIASLDNGATVRVGGMTAGEVETIEVPSGPASRFRVRMRVRNDLHPLVRTDSVASIQTDGLVGNKFVQIQSGTEQAAILPEGGTLKSREPMDIADLMEKLRETVERVNRPRARTSWSMTWAATRARSSRLGSGCRRISRPSWPAYAMEREPSGSCSPTTRCMSEPKPSRPKRNGPWPTFVRLRRRRGSPSPTCVAMMAR
jgi:ABC-type transporter Mla subunit MlaD